MKKLLSLCLIPFFLFAETINLNKIEVNAIDEGESEREFIIEKEGYMKSAPMQHQITISKALEVAGSNGDPVKVLKTFAGVVSTNNDDSSEIYIHGSKPRETRFTINHLPLGYFFHLGGFHSVLAPEMVQQIDAYLGGFDVSYGSMGAVVDITPKYPSSENKGRIHIGMYDADFALSGAITENTSIFIGARRSYFDLIASQIIDELDSDKNDKSKKITFTLFPQFYDGQFILKTVVDDHVLSLEAFIAKDEMKLNTTMDKDKDPVAKGKLENSLQSNTVGARWVYMGENLNSNTLLYRLNLKQKLKRFDANYFINVDIVEYGLYHESVFDIKDHKLMLGFEATHDKVPIKSYFYTLGVADEDNPITGRDTFNLDKTFTSKSYTIFAQDIYSITPSSSIRYGLRAFKIDFGDFGYGLDPRVAFVYHVNNTLTLSTAIGKYSQFPESIAVIDGFGNPKINSIEFSNHYTFSAQKKLSNSSSLIVEPFFKTFQNLAISDKVNNYEAVGEGEAYGLDITYKKNIDNLNITFAYTYVKAKRELNTDDAREYRFEGDIPHTLQLNTSYRFGNNYRFSLLAKYSSGAPYTPIVGTTDYIYDGNTYKKPIYGEYYSKRYKDYYDLDIQFGKTFKYGRGKSLELSLELMNLSALIRKNVSMILYDDEYKKDGVVEQIGFLPAIHATYRF
ncbi:MAG: TonB-dependent receptor plug domain-containing protein [Sulfurimonas sp.]|nr:TonB-dependent receptor plug domain-containing protein [Sulfurimonas sp.]